MKTLCSKSGKGGKIHPSPPADDFEQTAAALRLLPAAILVLAAVLRPEDQQVVAYLVTRSFQGTAAPEPQVVRGGRRRPHSPAIGCGCFDCYTSFWSRWDCSPDRDDIHRVIDAFEAHLADAESASSTPSSSKRRDKGKRKPPPSAPTPARQLMFPEKPVSQSGRAQEPSPAPASPPPPPPRQLMCPEKQPGMAQGSSPAPASPPPPPLPVASQDEEKVPEDSSKVEADAAAVEKSDAGKEEEERKRGWADVMGMLNLRLWGIWSPAVESAT